MDFDDDFLEKEIAPWWLLRSWDIIYHKKKSNGCRQFITMKTEVVDTRASLFNCN